MAPLVAVRHFVLCSTPRPPSSGVQTEKGRGRRRERETERGKEAGRQRQRGDRSVLFSLSGDRVQEGRRSLLSPTVFGPLRRTGPRISGGFGARPIFLTDKLTTTRAQLPVNIRESIQHYHYLTDLLPPFGQSRDCTLCTVHLT